MLSSLDGFLIMFGDWPRVCSAVGVQNLPFRRNVGTAE